MVEVGSAAADALIPLSPAPVSMFQPIQMVFQLCRPCWAKMWSSESSKHMIIYIGSGKSLTGKMFLEDLFKLYEWEIGRQFDPMEIHLWNFMISVRI